MSQQCCDFLLRPVGLDAMTAILSGALGKEPASPAPSDAKPIPPLEALLLYPRAKLA